MDHFLVQLQIYQQLLRFDQQSILNVIFFIFGDLFCGFYGTCSGATPDLSTSMALSASLSKTTSSLCAGDYSYGLLASPTPYVLSSNLPP